MFTYILFFLIMSFKMYNSSCHVSYIYVRVCVFVPYVIDPVILFFKLRDAQAR